MKVKNKKERKKTKKEKKFRWKKKLFVLFILDKF